MKRCFKCKRRKPIRMFYKHPMMADGHLGKCKGCTKKDVRANYRSRFKERREYERLRNRRPERKEQYRRYAKNRKIRNPGKCAARCKVSNAIRDRRLIRRPCEVCGDPKSHAHHTDYRKPFDVRWLCVTHHLFAHGKLRHLKSA